MEYLNGPQKPVNERQEDPWRSYVFSEAHQGVTLACAVLPFGSLCAQRLRAVVSYTPGGRRWRAAGPRARGGHQGLFRPFGRLDITASCLCGSSPARLRASNEGQRFSVGKSRDWKRQRLGPRHKSSLPVRASDPAKVGEKLPAGTK